MEIIQTDFNCKNTDLYIVYGSLNYEKQINGTKQLCSESNLFKVVKSEGRNTFEHKHQFEKSFPGNENQRNEDSLGTFSFQKAEKLSEIFCFIKNLHSSDKETKFILNTWDHGSVFGIFKVDDHLRVIETFDGITTEKFPYLYELISKIPGLGKDNKENENEFQFVFKNIIYTAGNISMNPKLFQSLYNEGKLKVQRDGNKLLLNEYPETSLNSDFEYFNNFQSSETGILEILTNEELAWAIEEGFGTLDILVMMNCWMMNLHNIYAIRNCVNYFVAPQGSIAKPAYDYKTVIEYIGNNNQADAENISKLYIISSYDFTDPVRSQVKTDILSWSLIAAKVKYNKEIIENTLVVVLKKFIEGLLNDFKEAENQSSLKLYQVRQFTLLCARSCFCFSRNSNYFQLDFLNLLKIYSIYNYDSNLQTFAQSLADNDKNWENEIEKALHQIIFYNPNIAPNPYLRYMEDLQFPFIGTNIFPPNGISIYYPLTFSKAYPEHKLFLLKEEKLLKLADNIPRWEELIKQITK